MKAYIGDYIVTSKYGYTGRVYNKHYGCPEDKNWIKSQSIPITENELDEIWYSILVHPKGAVVVPESDITKIRKFKFENPWNDFLFEK